MYTFVGFRLMLMCSTIFIFYWLCLVVWGSVEHFRNQSSPESKVWEAVRSLKECPNDICGTSRNWSVKCMCSGGSSFTTEVSLGWKTNFLCQTWIFKAVKFRNVFWIMLPCSLVDVYQRIGGTTLNTEARCIYIYIQFNKIHNLVAMIKF